jgi:hypothetical protein
LRISLKEIKNRTCHQPGCCLIYLFFIDNPTTIFGLSTTYSYGNMETFIKHIRHKQSTKLIITSKQIEFDFEVAIYRLARNFWTDL